MLRFPLRLTADLLFARFARGVSPVQFVDATEILHCDAGHPVSHERIREVTSGRSPIVWIGGSEPLHHAGVAHLVRAITHSGHFVFLETEGTLLRRRIHEFQPVSRLFLTVRLDPSAQRRSSNALRPGAFELALEGIRAARLSGFFVCVLARVAAETKLTAAEELIQLAHSLDADGLVISPVCVEPDCSSPAAESSRQKTSEARKRIGSFWWQSFSKLVEPLLLHKAAAAPAVDASSVHLEEQAGADEEGVKVA
jgi:molybdenum cofactor biosynthesis enzyme MoaA